MTEEKGFSIKIVYPITYAVRKSKSAMFCEAGIQGTGKPQTHFTYFPDTASLMPKLSYSLRYVTDPQTSLMPIPVFPNTK